MYFMSIRLYFIIFNPTLTRTDKSEPLTLDPNPKRPNPNSPNTNPPNPQDNPNL